jgi:hypothetical protein
LKLGVGFDALGDKAQAQRPAECNDGLRDRASLTGVIDVGNERPIDRGIEID